MTNQSLEDVLRRQVLDYEGVALQVQAARALGKQIVLTIGSFDQSHIGHYRYLMKARGFGDYLVVGVDSDRAVKLYKGETRPMVPEGERMEALLHLPYPDIVTILDDVDDDGKWGFGLLEVVKPDVFVAVTDSYSQEQLDEIERQAGRVEVIPRQAETSTSAQIRKAALAMNRPVIDQMRELLDKMERGEE